LEKVIATANHAGAFGSPAYNEALVAELTAGVKTSGRVAEGRAVFNLPQLSCAVCHKLGDQGGALGPELTAVGAGLPVDLLVEAVLWPARQVKEGYLATTLKTSAGETLSGYVQTHDRDQVVIRDAASGATRTVATSQIASRADAGTLMPPGLASSLTRQQLVDLIRFLSELKGGGTSP
jgi:putative heme-binding domain-containing protein